MAEISMAEIAEQIGNLSYSSKVKKDLIILNESHTFNISQKEYLDIINDKVSKLIELKEESLSDVTDENSIFLIPDTRGDFLSFYGSLILSGAFTIVENEYIFYDKKIIK